MASNQSLCLHNPFSHIFEPFQHTLLPINKTNGKSLVPIFGLTYQVKVDNLEQLCLINVSYFNHHFKMLHPIYYIFKISSPKQLIHALMACHFYALVNFSNAKSTQSRSRVIPPTASNPKSKGLKAKIT